MFSAIVLTVCGLALACSVVYMVVNLAMDAYYYGDRDAMKLLVLLLGWGLIVLFVCLLADGMSVSIQW